MFFDEVKLSKKSWHYKLMKFTWGQSTPNLWSFCPYFWLTIFNFIILPITLVVRGFQEFVKFLDRKLFIEPYERFLKAMAEDELFIGAVLDHDVSSKKIPQKSMFKKRSIWDFASDLEKYLVKKWGTEWEYDEKYRKKRAEIYQKYWQHRDELRKRRDEAEALKYRERESKRRELLKKREANQKKLEKYLSPFFFLGEKISTSFFKISTFFKNPDVYKIVKITKQTVSFIIVSALILTAGYFLFWGVSYLYNFFKVDMNWSWKFFLTGQKYIFYGMSFIWAGAIIGYLLVKSLKKPFEKFTEWVRETDFDIPVSLEPFIKLMKFIFVAPFMFLLIKPFSFFMMYFKAVKNDHCPAIIWEDDEK